MMVAALVIMTGAFTALSSGGVDRSATATDIDEFVLVNGDEVGETDFQSRVATVEQNVMMLTAQADSVPEGSPQADSLQQTLEIMGSTPPETVALASLILDTAIYQEAVERGHLPDPEMIAQQVEQERQAFEMIESDPEQFNVDESDVARYRANVDEVGEDVYWNETFPQILEQQAAVQQFQTAASEEGEDWIDVQRQVFENADVQVGDPDAIAPATVADAGAYLNEIWNAYQDAGES